MAQGSTRYNLAKTNLLNGRFLLPPKREQQVIAEALSDADAAIESLDALIAKKRDMKQAAMQQLLTGRTRLPGFAKAWREMAYNELTWHRAGNGALIKGKVYQSPGVGRISAFSASGQDVWCEFADYSEPGLVISAVGSRCGKVFRAAGKWTAIANTHVLFSDQERCDLDFLWYRVNDENFWVKGGTGQPFVLVRESLKQVQVWPEVNEQRAIAEVLSDMDDEIDALVARREKAELVKQGMMQSLLTGKVRLPC
jgi:type I restriction enzyme S subunit